MSSTPEQAGKVLNVLVFGAHPDDRGVQPPAPPRCTGGWGIG